MGSYFWMFSANAVRSKVFKDFWLNYKPTSSKYYTVRNGERRFTPYLKKGGVSPQPLLNDGIVFDWLKTVDNENLFRHMHEITSHSSEYSDRMKIILHEYADTTEWRKKALDIVGKITNRKNILATAPTLAILEFNVGFFKKGSDAGGIHAIRFLIERISQNSAIKKPYSVIWDEMLERSKKQH
jgi:lipopolysaccharide biosynthesis protein